MRRTSHPLALLVAAALLLAAVPALAADSPAVTDCNSHGQLTHTYSLTQLRAALNTMPPTVKEYTNCYDVINRALLTQVGSPAGGGSAGKGSGGSFLPAWLIVVLALLVLGGGGYALAATRARGKPGS